jgi:hypothetical protein
MTLGHPWPAEEDGAMQTTDGAYPPALRPGLAIGLSLALAGALHVAQVCIADSPYWMGLSHRPLTVALLAAMSLVDWSREAKVVVILGASIPVMLDSGRRLLGHGFASPRSARTAAARTAPRRPAMATLEIAR